VVDYAELASIAETLIEANGRTVTVNKLGITPSDVNKPWRGQSAPAQTTVSGAAVFVTMSDAEFGMLVQNDGVIRGEQVALFAANNDGSNALEDFDQIVDGSVAWRILRTQLLRPGSTRLLYMFEVAR